jgi:hypothetical protein
VSERSADQAGYFESGRDRLVMPAFNAVNDGGRQGTQRVRHGGGGDGGGGEFHPLIQRLLGALPAPGADWSIADRAKWLQTASSVFDRVYNPGSDQEGFIHIEIWEL